MRLPAVGAALLVIVTAGIVVPRVGPWAAASRDEQRLEDFRTLQSAIEEFARARGRLPKANAEKDHAGWDTTLDGSFLSELVEEGYLDREFLDPRNDELYHYRYFVYEAGYEGFDSDFYVLGVRNFETADGKEQGRRTFRGERRDWGDEFACSAGGTAR